MGPEQDKIEHAQLEQGANKEGSDSPYTGLCILILVAKHTQSKNF